MEEYKTYTLEEISKGKGTYGIAASAVEYDPALHTYLRITDINDDGTLNKSGLMSVDEDNAGDYLLKPNDIVFARTGNSTGRAYFYDGSDGELVFAGFLIKFSLDPKKVNPRIIKYYTHSKPYYDWVQSFDTGGTRGNINAKTYGNMPIVLPSRSTQDRIVEILKSIDDKIDVNKHINDNLITLILVSSLVILWLLKLINDNLEQQARALFKSWFVDFEPFKDGEFVDSELGMIPKGWKVVHVEDLSEKMASGGTPPSLNQNYYSGEIKWFSTKELKDCFLFDSEKHISVNAVNNSAAKIFPQDTVLMAIYAAPTVGRLGILSQEGTFNQAAVGIIPKKEIGKEFIYLMLLFERVKLNNLASGAAQQNLNVGIVKQYKVILPEQSVLNKFNMAIKPLFDKNCIVQQESHHLANLRDTLLPCLMSGKLKVCDMNV